MGIKYNVQIQSSSPWTSLRTEWITRINLLLTSSLGIIVNEKAEQAVKPRASHHQSTPPPSSNTITPPLLSNTYPFPQILQPNPQTPPRLSNTNPFPQIQILTPSLKYYHPTLKPHPCSQILTPSLNTTTTLKTPPQPSNTTTCLSCVLNE